MQYIILLLPLAVRALGEVGLVAVLVADVSQLIVAAVAYAAQTFGQQVAVAVVQVVARAQVLELHLGDGELFC